MIALATSAAIVAGMSALAAPARAQDSGQGFLFDHPTASVTLRGGFDYAIARSDVFAFTTNQLTLSRAGFSAPSLGIDLAYWMGPHVDVALGVSASSSSQRSRFRHFLDQDNLPIEQKTEFVRVPLSASVKYYLTPRGRSIGRFAWIPSRFSPYVAAGAGAMWYRFSQSGDFIDFQTNDVFNDTFQSSGWTPEAHAMGGFDYSLNTRFSLTGEARYTWAKANLGRDFSGFNRIDLSGLMATTGISVRF